MPPLRTTPMATPARQRGITLIEMMVAFVLGLLVIAAAGTVYLTNRKTGAANTALSQAQTGLSTAYTLLIRNLRQAGATGCGNTRITNVLTDGPIGPGTHAWYLDFAHNRLRGFDGNSLDAAIHTGSGTGERVAGTSSVRILSVTLPLMAVRQSTPDTLTVNATTPALQPGRIVVICDPNHATIAQLTSNTTAGNTATLAFAASGANCTSALGFPSTCTHPQKYVFGTNAQVSPLSAQDWYIGHNPVGGRSLYRVTLAGGQTHPGTQVQEMVRGLTQLELDYRLNGSATFVSAAQVGTAWDRVVAVKLALTARGTGRNDGMPDQSVTRTYSGVVVLRNPL